MLPARPNGSECGGKTVFEIGRSYPEGRKGRPFLPETWPSRTPSAGRWGRDFHNLRSVNVKDVWSDVMTKNHNVNGNIL